MLALARHGCDCCMNLAEVTELFELIAPRAAPLNALLTFDFGADGSVSIDARREPVRVGRFDEASDTTFTVSLADFKRILNRELPGDLAFAMGKMRISGDLITGMGITAMLGD